MLKPHPILKVPGKGVNPSWLKTNNKIRSFNSIISFYFLLFLEINEIEFRDGEEKLFDIMYKVRTIECLKLQIGNDIAARGEKKLEKILKNYPDSTIFFSYSRSKHSFP